MAADKKKKKEGGGKKLIVLLVLIVVLLGVMTWRYYGATDSLPWEGQGIGHFLQFWKWAF